MTIPFIYQSYRIFSYDDTVEFMGYPNIRTFMYIVAQSFVFIQITIVLFLISYRKDVFSYLTAYYLFIFSCYTMICKIFLIDYMISNFVLAIIGGTLVFYIIKYIKTKFYSSAMKVSNINEELYYYNKYHELLFQIHHGVNHELAAIQGLTNLLKNDITDKKIAIMLEEKTKKLKESIIDIEKKHRL